MQEQAILRAVDALVAARRTGTREDALPGDAHPTSIDEAHDIQDRVIAALGEQVAGWKVSITPAGVMRGAVLGSRLLESPATIASAGLPLLGIEAEIAFMFERTLPPRAAEYTTAEVAAATIAMVAIEIVGTRFRDYVKAPPMDRTADCMSNEYVVLGTRRPDWRGRDLAQLEASLVVNGAVLVRKSGGHVTTDPIVPAVALVNALRHTTGMLTGQFITTGTFTGIHRANPGNSIAVSFTDFGEASVDLEDR